jgi:hypothetical protein
MLPSYKYLKKQSHQPSPSNKFHLFHPSALLWGAGGGTVGLLKKLGPTEADPQLKATRFSNFKREDLSPASLIPKSTALPPGWATDSNHRRKEA